MMWFRLFFRTLRLSLSNFWANKKQNLLSISAVVLGSLAIAAVFTVNENIDVYVDSLVSESGGPNIFVYSKVEDLAFGRSDLTQVRSLSSNRYVVKDAQLPVNAIHKSQTKDLVVSSFDHQYVQARPVTVVEGQFLSDLDLHFASRNIVLTPQAVIDLDIENPVGKDLIINSKGLNFLAHIIGVAKAQYDSTDKGAGWVSKDLFRALAQSDSVSSIIVGSVSYTRLDDFEEEILSVLRPKFKDNISSHNPKSEFDSIRTEYQTFIDAGTIIGFLSLFGGCVGVMNLMLMNVRLRVKEIGLYRALGFSTGIVLLILIIESMITLNLGGFLGSLLGCIAGYFIASHIVTTPPFLSASAFVFSFSASAFIGLFFSYLPASRAAKMDTVEALRS